MEAFLHWKHKMMHTASMENCVATPKKFKHKVTRDPAILLFKENHGYTKTWNINIHCNIIPYKVKAADRTWVAIKQWTDKQNMAC